MPIQPTLFGGHQAFSWASQVALVVKILPANTGDVGSIPGSGRPSGAGNGTLVFFPGRIHGQRSLAGYSPWGLQESDTTEQMACSYFFMTSGNLRLPSNDSVEVGSFTCCRCASVSPDTY